MKHPLSNDVIARASLRGREYAWRPDDVEMAINDARSRGLETLGGQVQFRLPDGTCELYWISIDPSARQLEEPWHAWVERSANEVIERFRQMMTTKDWSQEIQNWPFLRDKAASGVDVLSCLCFVLYFENNPTDCRAEI